MRRDVADERPALRRMGAGLALAAAWSLAAPAARADERARVRDAVLPPPLVVDRGFVRRHPRPRAWTTPPPGTTWDVPRPPRDAPYWYERYFSPRTSADRASLAASAALSATSGLLLANADRKTVQLSSDVGQFLLPGVALAATLREGDWRDVVQFGYVMATAMSVVLVAKKTLEKTRPNGDDESYPSGHTAPAFAAATFLYGRYGPRVGIPAYVLAIHTGVARQVSRKHFLEDIIAGAGIGFVSAGIFEALCGPAPGFSRRANPRLRVEFGVGGLWQSKNRVQAPAGSGTAFDISAFDGASDVRPTARLSLAWRYGGRSELLLRLLPTEVRGERVLDAALRFDGTTFPAGTAVAARWLGAEYKLTWRTRVGSNGPLSLAAGATLLLADYAIELESQVGAARVERFRPAPLPHAVLAWVVRPGLSASVTADGMPGVAYTGFDLEAALRQDLGGGWDAGVAWRWSRRSIGAGIENDPTIQDLHITVGRSL
jgi:membrane-associated phospholipid phosphatase